MGYEEKKNAFIREKSADFYAERLNAAESIRARTENQKTIVTPEDMPWENCSQGLIKHLVHEKMETAENTLDIVMQIITGGSRSGKHRHFGEEFMFILEGRGYSLHWDVEMDLGESYSWRIPETFSRWEWEAGDSVYIPPNTVHQHFNLNAETPVRFISAESRMVRFMRLDDLEQLEDAPEFQNDEKPTVNQ